MQVNMLSKYKFEIILYLQEWRVVDNSRFIDINIFLIGFNVVFSKHQGHFNFDFLCF